VRFILIESATRQSCMTSTLLSSFTSASKQKDDKATAAAFEFLCKVSCMQRSILRSNWAMPGCYSLSRLHLRTQCVSDKKR